MNDFLKGLVKAVTTKDQRHAMCLWAQRCGMRCYAFFGAAVNLLPFSWKVFLRSTLNAKKRMDYSKADIFIDVASSLEAEVRANSCVKEPETVAWIEHDLRPGDVLWDIGANIGAYSLVAAKCHGGKVKICAFEPSFLNFAQLCRNIALNDCGEVIFPLNIALSEKTCVGHFNHQNLVSGGALHAFGEALDYKHEAFRPVLRQDLLSFSVDDLIRIFSLPSPDHIKLDVDGLEMAIMNGAEQTLVGKKVRTILVELGDRDEQLIAFFKRHGFAVREKHPAGPEASHLFNCILVRS